MLCLWPGLARLWFRGDFSALVTAIGFTLLLNLALVSTFLWTSWPSEGFPIVIWPIVAFIWIGSAIVTFWQLEQIVHPRHSAAESQDTLLIRAQTEYLKGNWSEVTSLINERLKREPRNVPARLLLATLFRRTGNLEKAAQQLDVLSRFDESCHWQFEIARERDLIQEFAAAADEISSDPVEQNTNNLKDNRVDPSTGRIDNDYLDEKNPDSGQQDADRMETDRFDGARPRAA